MAKVWVDHVWRTKNKLLESDLTHQREGPGKVNVNINYETSEMSGEGWKNYGNMERTV